MPNFSATSAAFYGFGLIKRDPLTFLSVTILFTAFFIWAFLSVGGLYVQMFATMLEDPNDQEAILQASMLMMSRVGLIYLAMIPIYAVTLGAVQRSLVHGQSQGWILGLRLGLDELRIILVTIVCYILVLIPYIVTAIVGGIIIGVAVGASGNEAAAVLVFPVILIALGVMAWVGIRLSAAGPATIGEQRFVIFESWEITKGRFWSLFLAYLLLFVVILLIEFVAVLIIGAVAAPWAAEAATAGSFDPDAVFEFSLSPMVVVGGVIYASVMTFFLGAMLGVGASGYLDWKQSQTAVT